MPDANWPVFNGRDFRTSMSSLDYSIFAASDFSPNEYANAILASDAGLDTKTGAKGSGHVISSTHDSVTKEDISVAISKLTFGIDDVSKQIRNLVGVILPVDVPNINCIVVEVTAHHEELLVQASNANALSGALVSVRTGLNDLENSVEKCTTLFSLFMNSTQLFIGYASKFMCRMRHCKPC